MALPKRTKKKTVRAAPRIKRGGKLADPKWDGWEEWSGEQFHKFAQGTREFYYQNFKPADLYPFTWTWMGFAGGLGAAPFPGAQRAPIHGLAPARPDARRLILRV